ncbi:MAG TPA: phenylalanine--tRNA ligase beta subunit-related protein, partial [Longilinea sp.]|nr:phenylalanine--tRNA ligase beta subunit-related protein [Longilinea sp.]
MFEVTQDWSTNYPHAHAGILAMEQVENPALHAGLEERKRVIENDLRVRFAGQDPHALEALVPIRAYSAYYKRFDKTYHVLGQLTSVVFKGKSIPSTAALVEAMFMAELKNMLLTAGHDLDQLRLPVTLGVANGDEHYTLLRGQEQVLKPGDMFMADQAGVISSILYGPDQRTQINAATKNVLFAVYAPEGIDPQAVQVHLEDIRDLVLLIAPSATIKLL